MKRVPRDEHFNSLGAKRTGDEELRGYRCAAITFPTAFPGEIAGKSGTEACQGLGCLLGLGKDFRSNFLESLSMYALA